MRVLSICKMDQHYLASFLFSAKISIPAKILARSLATDPLSGTRQIFSEFSFSFDFFRTRQFIGEFTCLRPCLENSPRVTQPCDLANSATLEIPNIKSRDFAHGIEIFFVGWEIPQKAGLKANLNGN